MSSAAMEMLKFGSFEHARKVSALFWRGAAAQAGVAYIAGIPVATPLHQHQAWHVRLGGFIYDGVLLASTGI